MKILLDYFFPITIIEPTPAASTSFLKQALLVVAPLSGGTPLGVITACTTMAQVNALTANTEAQYLFNAGMDKVYIMPQADLDMSVELDGHGEFFTVLISSDFANADITQTKAFGTFTVTSYANLVSGTADTVTIDGIVLTAQSGAATLGTATFQAATSNNATAASLAAQINAHPTLSAKYIATVSSAVVTVTSLANGASGNAIAINYTDNDTNVGITKSGTHLTGGAGLEVGTFKGVVGLSSTDDTFLAAQAALPNVAAFHTTSSNKAKNMCYAFGKLLSNASDWLNQQYISLPFADDITTVGAANILFDDRINFCISDTDFGNRLALFAAGGKAIVAPYIERNLQIDFQSRALTYISGNEPSFSLTQAALIQDELQKVLETYVNEQWITAGTVDISLVQDNFVANAEINIAEPKALWRIFGEMRQTL